MNIDQYLTVESLYLGLSKSLNSQDNTFPYLISSRQVFVSSMLSVGNSNACGYTFQCYVSYPIFQSRIPTISNENIYEIPAHLFPCLISSHQIFVSNTLSLVNSNASLRELKSLLCSNTSHNFGNTSQSYVSWLIFQSRILAISNKQ